MSCSITLDPLLTVESDTVTNAPVGLVIQGFCLGCSSPALQVTLTQTPGIDETVPAPVVNGVWTATFQPHRQYDCGSSVTLRVTVLCPAEPNCGIGPKDMSFQVQCRTGPCPPAPPKVSLLPPMSMPQGPCRGSLRRIDFTADFTPPVTPDNARGFFRGSDGVSTPLLTQHVDHSGAAPVGRFSTEGLPDWLFAPGEHAVAFELADYPGCLTGLVFTVDVCHCTLTLEVFPQGSTDAPVLTVAMDGTVSVPNHPGPPPACLDAGTYEIQAKVDGLQLDWDYNWSRNGGALAERSAALSGVTLAAGDPPQIFQVTISPPGCDPLSNQVMLRGCSRDCPPPGSGFQIDVRITQANGMTGPLVFSYTGSETPVCVAPGGYDLIVVSPTGAQGWVYTWSVAGAVVQSGTSPTFSGYQLAADGRMDRPLLLVESPFCPSVNTELPLRACACPVKMQLRISKDGTEIPEGQCVEPGVYTAEVTGVGNAGGIIFDWSVDGVPDPAKSSATSVLVQAAISCEDTGLPNQDSIATYRVAVQPRPENPEVCPTPLLTRDLKVCPKFVFCPWCLFLRILIIVLGVLGAFGIALVPCEMITRPWILDQLFKGPGALAAITAIQAVLYWGRIVAIVVGIVSAAVAAALALLVYRPLCKPKTCDWALLIGQILLGAAFLMAYFGSCPYCLPTIAVSLGLAGLALLFSAISWAWWWVNCKPGLCRLIAEITIVFWITSFPLFTWAQFLLGACVAAWGAFILALWTTAAWVLVLVAAVCTLFTTFRYGLRWQK